MPRPVGPDDRGFELILSAEGRTGPQVRDIVGPRGVSKEKAGDLETAIRTGAAKAVAGAAVAAVAATNPVTAALYLAYQVAKYAYPIVKAGVETKIQTGDSEAAMDAVKQETVNQVGKAAVDAAAGVVSDALVNGATNAVGIHAGEPAKKFVSAAVSEAITEVIE